MPKRGLPWVWHTPSQPINTPPESAESRRFSAVKNFLPKTIPGYEIRPIGPLR